MDVNQIVLDTPDEPRIDLVNASQGKRLLTHIIDVIIWYIIVTILVVVYTVFVPWSSNNFEYFYVYMLSIYSIYFIGYFGYYIGMEFGFKGKTIGKMIAKTRVVTESGHTPSVGQVVGRTFIRLIPFEFLTGLSSAGMWHDQWTKTEVIDEKQSHTPFENEVY